MPLPRTRRTFATRKNEQRKPQEVHSVGRRTRVRRATRKIVMLLRPHPPHTRARARPRETPTNKDDNLRALARCAVRSYRAHATENTSMAKMVETSPPRREVILAKVHAKMKEHSIFVARRSGLKFRPPARSPDSFVKTQNSPYPGAPRLKTHLPDQAQDSRFKTRVRGLI